VTSSVGLRDSEMGEKGNDFVVLFLDNENTESVHAEEVEEIDFYKILLYLNRGGSVFIANKKFAKRKRCCSQSP
jgi:hypothetical protein